MLRALGAGKNAAENALRTEYQRETMSDRRESVQPKPVQRATA
jgi:hypothetical protein